jgi:hypothetical protein
MNLIFIKKKECQLELILKNLDQFIYKIFKDSTRSKRKHQL